MKTMKSLIAFGIVLSMLLMQLTIPASAATGTQPVNPNASDEAKELLQLLYNVTGNGIITGVYNWHAIPEERTETLRRKIGVYPGIWNTDFGYGGDVGPEGMVDIRNGVVETAIRHHEAGDLVSLMWHAVKPSDSEWAGWGSVQGWYSEEDFDMLLTPGTALHNKLLAQIDDIAGYLKVLRDAGVPVLWRPYHECDGGWFWWGGQHGGERFVQLWRIMYDRYTNYHNLDNLIWVWNVSHGASASKMFEYYPGNEYVDVCSVDIYSNPYYDQNIYNNLKLIANGKPIALGEVGVLPDMNNLISYQPDYCFYIMWADWVTNGEMSDYTLRNTFNNDYCFNRGEIPTDLPDVDGPGILPDYDDSMFADVYVTDKGMGYVTLEWKGFESQAAGYRVFMNNTGGEELADIYVSSGQGGNTTISGLQPDTNYTFCVMPYGGAETGWYWFINNTRTITVRTLDTNPGEPAIATATADETSIYVALKEVESNAKHVIQVYNMDNNEELVAEREFTGATVGVDGLEPATRYRISISAKDGSYGPMIRNLQTSGIVAYNVTTDSISIRWFDFFPEKALYKVLWGNNSRDVYDCNITIDGLQPNTTYNFNIVGVDSGWGWSGGNREISVKTKALEIPTLDSIDVGEYDLQFNLIYVDENGQNHITLYDNDNNKAVVYDADFTGDTVKIEDLSHATSYSYKITSKSNEFSAFTGDTQTAGIKAINVTTNSVTLRWHDFFPAKVLYKVQVGDRYIDVYGLQETIDGLQPDTSYDFTIAAVDANWGWPVHYTYTVRTLPNKNQILSVENGTVKMHIVDAAALADYTLIVASYDGKELKKVELFNPAASVNYTQVAGTTTKAFLWNMATLQPYAN